ncbi:MAG: hypothetical protein GY787_21540 [Alteromonadales bacterium]|nr:hypothetical protein [Alteromonadales bacterium]
MMPKPLAYTIVLCLQLYGLYLFITLINDYISLHQLISIRFAQISFDSGAYYGLLMLIFPVMGIFQLQGFISNIEPSTKVVTVTLVGIFLASYLAAYLFPVVLESRLLDNGYKSCFVEPPPSRISKGKSKKFVLKNLVCS